MLHFSLADDWLSDPTNGSAAGLRRNFHRYLHADVAIGVYVRRNVQVHADVNVLELRVNQWIHEARAAGGTNTNASLEAAGGNRDAITNFKFCRLTVDSAKFGVLHNFRAGIGQEKVCRSSGKCEYDIVLIQVR